MIWYTGHYGSWNDPRGVERLDFSPKGEEYKHITGTYSRKEVFAKAQEVANETGKVVTVMWDIPRAGVGLEGHSAEVYPQEVQK